MNPTALVIVALTLFFGSALVTWAWLALSEVESDLRSISGFEGMHFEVGAQRLENADDR